MPISPWLAAFKVIHHLFIPILAKGNTVHSKDVLAAELIITASVSKVGFGTVLMKHKLYWKMR